jgi:hypothetical protein
MRRVLSIAFAALAVLGATSVLAQQPESTALPAFHGVTWAFDSVHGKMQATPAAPIFIPGKPDPALIAEANPTTTTYTGTIKMIVTVDLISPIPQGTVLNCNSGVGLNYEILKATGTIGLINTGGTFQSQENIQVTASGTKATCSLSIPYVWTVPASTATTLVVVQGISGSVQISAQYSNNSGLVPTSINRYTQVELAGPTTIPPDGTITTLTATAAL